MYFMRQRLSGERKLEGKQYWTPERRLLLALLKRAILDYLGTSPNEAKLAAEWIFFEGPKPHKRFSFDWVCEQLDLDPRQKTRVIRKLKRDSMLSSDESELLCA